MSILSFVFAEPYRQMISMPKVKMGWWERKRHKHEFTVLEEEEHVFKLPLRMISPNDLIESHHRHLKVSAKILKCVECGALFEEIAPLVTNTEPTYRKLKKTKRK